MKILTIGAGSIGSRHVKNIASFAEAAIYDHDTARCTKIGKDLSIPSFSNENLAWDWKPDAVVIATPHASHLSFAKKAVNAGVSALIEKPFSHNMSGVNSLLKLAKDKEVKLFVVSNLRFHPAIKYIRENLSKIGKPLFVRAHYGNYLPNMRPDDDYRKLYAASKDKGGGVVLDAIHEVDYLTWLFGDAISVTASSSKLSDLDIDVEDFSSMTIKHTTGVHSVVTVDYLQQFKRRGCEVIGTEGTLIWASEGKKPEHCTVSYFSKKDCSWEVIFKEKDLDANEQYKIMMKSFLDELNGKSTCLASGNEGANALRTSINVLKAAKSGRTIYI